jgi:hypothetical protein
LIDNEEMRDNVGVALAAIGLIVFCIGSLIVWGLGTTFIFLGAAMLGLSIAMVTFL